MLLVSPNDDDAQDNLGWGVWRKRIQIKSSHILFDSVVVVHCITGNEIHVCFISLQGWRIFCQFSSSTRCYSCTAQGCTVYIQGNIYLKYRHYCNLTSILNDLLFIWSSHSYYFEIAIVYCDDVQSSQANIYNTKTKNIYKISFVPKRKALYLSYKCVYNYIA